MRAAGKVEVVSFGCRLNQVESEAMRRQALAAGHGDVAIVNSCAVTAEAARQGRQAIRRLGRERPHARILVTGCASETEPARFRAMAEIDAILPNRVKAEAATWQALATNPRRGVAAAASDNPCDSPARHTRAFVEIQNGCDHRCSFCIIPFGRGASRSTPIAEILDRIRTVVADGAMEAVLTGVDITAYGSDFGDGTTLGRLVRRILADVPALPRLRLSSLDCIEVDPVLIDCLATEPRLMPHLHLSLQSGSDLILKRMKRRHSRAAAIAFCDTVRAARPETVFGADFIAGFPTETEPLFEQTLDMVEACGLTHIHVFPFSSRPGTPAARMPGVASEAVRARASRLRALGEVRLRSHLDAQIGRTLDVLTEHNGTGHAADFTRIRLPGDTQPGLLMSLRAREHDGRALLIA